MSDSYEEYIHRYERSLNKSSDEWFDARPNIVRDRDFERVFEGGFRMAYELKHPPLSTPTETP